MKTFKYYKLGTGYKEKQYDVIKLKDKEWKGILNIVDKRTDIIKNRGDLEQHGSDGEDFIEVSVWELEELLVRAFLLGKEN